MRQRSQESSLGYGAGSEPVHWPKEGAGAGLSHFVAACGPWKVGVKGDKGRSRLSLEGE